MLMKPPTDPDAPTDRPGTAREVLTSFFRLSLTSFGGPIAHLGYFRSEFVERRRWLDDRSCSNLVALCQFLPGPASSQVGMALGLSRAGWWGALAAWIGFTLPSAVALILFAYGIAEYGDLASSGAVQGLKVAAVAVVAQAVWGMGKTLCPDRLRAGLAIFAALLTLVVPTAWGQVGAILVSGFLGWWLLEPAPPPVTTSRQSSYGVSRRAGGVALAVFMLLLFGLPWGAAASGSTL